MFKIQVGILFRMLSRYGLLQLPVVSGHTREIIFFYIVDHFLEPIIKFSTTSSSGTLKARSSLFEWTSIFWVLLERVISTVKLLSALAQPNDPGVSYQISHFAFKSGSCQLSSQGLSSRVCEQPADGCELPLTTFSHRNATRSRMCEISSSVWFKRLINEIFCYY